MIRKFGIKRSYLHLFSLLLIFLFTFNAFAALCDPENLEKMSPAERKQAEIICAKVAGIEAQSEESKKEKEEKFNKYIKGHKAMEQVYHDHKDRLPTNSQNKGEEIIWTYMTKTSDAIFSECEEFVFQNKGDELKSTRKYKCE